MPNNGEFKGSTKQALVDINSRLDRIEEKLDRQIERNMFISAIISGGVAVVALFLRK